MPVHKKRLWNFLTSLRTLPSHPTMGEPQGFSFRRNANKTNNNPDLFLFFAGFTKYSKVDEQDGHEVTLGYGATSRSTEDVGVKVTDEVHVYRRRWLMLLLFCLYSFSNAVQWIHLNIIANVLDRYYNASLPADTYQVSIKRGGGGMRGDS